MYTLNRSKGISYYTQRNNKKRPSSACNVTAATQTCVITGHKIPAPTGMQAEDYLMSFLESQEAVEKLKSFYPYATFNPWNTSHCIAWAVNKALGKEVCRVEKRTLQEILFHLVQGGGAVVGGRFTRGGHFISIVGFKSMQNYTKLNSPEDLLIKAVNSIIIDDPWGDYTAGYREHSGDDIEIPVEDFQKLIFGRNDVKTTQMYYSEEVL